jgi:hypothetical protein
LVKDLFPTNKLLLSLVVLGWFINIVMIGLIAITDMYPITTNPIIELRLLGVVFYPIGFLFGIVDTEIFIQFLIGN